MTNENAHGRDERGRVESGPKTGAVPWPVLDHEWQDVSETPSEGADDQLGAQARRMLFLPISPDAGERLTRLVARGEARLAALLSEEGGALTDHELAARLGVTVGAIEGQRAKGELLGIPGTGEQYLYPVWQLDGKQILPGLVAVLGDLRRHDPVMQLAFFLSRNLRLGGLSPLHALRNGDIEAARRAARAYGEQGAA